MTNRILPRVIGHRGAAASAPENTLAGFAHAAALGVRWVELDVQLSADDVPVVFHDTTLERTTNGRGSLIETPLAVLRRLDAGAWFAPEFAGQRVPTLSEALTAISAAGLGLCLEVKADEARGARTAEIALAEAQRLWPSTAPPPMVSSFSRSALAVAHVAAPRWPRGFLADALSADWVAQARHLGCCCVHTRAAGLDRQRVAEIKAAGFGLLAYTVNEPADAVRLWGWDVDGVFSDCPDRILETIPSNAGSNTQL